LSETFSRERVLSKIVVFLERFFGDKLLSIILFGSTVYMGFGRDIDLIVVVDEEIDLYSKFDTEYRLRSRLCLDYRLCGVDIHVMDIDLFKENLKPSTFLSGLALGYKILYDRIGIEKQILDFMEKLVKEKYIIHNKYGSWNISFYAERILKRKHYKQDSTLKQRLRKN